MLRLELCWRSLQRSLGTLAGFGEGKARQGKMRGTADSRRGRDGSGLCCSKNFFTNPNEDLRIDSEVRCEGAHSLTLTLSLN